MLATRSPGAVRGGLCLVGERPGDEGALFCSGGWCVVGLDNNGCIIFDAAGGDCCLTGEKAGGPVAGRD